MTAPTLTTERLTLRPHVMADFPGFRTVLTGLRAVYMDGPHDDLGAWHMFCADVAHWSLRGIGGLAVTRKTTGEVVGQVAITHPPHFPELELGWLTYDGHEGQGYVTEAAGAFRDWAFAQGWPTLVSYIDPGNDRSIAVAERLGARRDAAAPRPSPEDLVYRHAAKESAA